MRRLVQLLLAFLGLIAIALGIGAFWQARSIAADERTFPMPGKLVDIGGRRLHLYCSGSGAPTVILENGLTANYAAWQLVQPEVARFTQVCSYDRADMGYSDPSNNPTQARFVAADLQALREHANLLGPTILVGWSAGGVFARELIHEHPQGIIGLVLVDSSHEQQGNRMPTSDKMTEQQAQLEQRLHLCAYVNWTGLLRLNHVHANIMAQQPIPKALAPELLALANRNNYCPGILKESTGFPTDVQSKAPPASLGALPLIVLTRGRPSSASEVPFPVSEQDLRNFDNAWWQLQSELVALSTNAKQIRIPNSGHLIPFERPDAVVEAVRELVFRVRSNSASTVERGT